MEKGGGAGSFPPSSGLGATSLWIVSYNKKPEVLVLKYFLYC